MTDPTDVVDPGQIVAVLTEKALTDIPRMSLLMDRLTAALEDFKTKVDRIPSQDLVAKLVKMEDRPWIEWRNEKPITPRQIAKLLEQFKIAPRNIKLMGSVAKGYMAEDFTDAFARYTASETATPLLSKDTVP